MSPPSCRALAVLSVRWLTQRRLEVLFRVTLIVQALLFLGVVSSPGVYDRQGRVRGRDFLQFYVAGQIVVRGEADRLYDQEYFAERQRSILDRDEKELPYRSIYPPNAAMMFAPLASLPYGRAIEAWWFIQAACFLAAGSLLLRQMNPPPDWRHTAWLGLLSFYPVIVTMWFGQLAACLLLAWAAGLGWRRAGAPFAGGCVLSVLTIKPQLALGIVLWLILQRDLRTLAGFCVGILLQAVAVAAVLTPTVIGSFVRNARPFQYFFPANFQHATAGILFDLLGDGYERWALAVHGLVVLCAVVLLYRVVRSRPMGRGRIEATAGVLFSLLATPHLLTYDLAYLLIPITYLISLRMSANDPGVPISALVLYVCGTLTPFYGFLGFSILPLVFLWALDSLIPVSRQVPEGESQSAVIPDAKTS